MLVIMEILMFLFIWWKRELIYIKISIFFLKEACSRGYFDIVEFLYNKGADINANKYIIIDTILSGNVETVNFLIEKKISNLQND